MAPARRARCALALTVAFLAAGLAPASAGAAWFAYTANRGANNIGQYSIGSDGALASMGTTTAVTNSAPWDVVVSPDAKSLYASYSGSLNAVAEFDIGPDGTLTPKPGHETIAAGGGPNNLAISPDGKNLYASNYTGDSISEYHIGDGGVLSANIVDSMPGGTGPVAFAIAPDGQTAYSANYDDGSVGFFTPLPDGAFGHNDVLAIDCGGMSSHPNDLRLSPDGASLYVTDGQDQVCQFDAGGGFARKLPAELGVAGVPWGVEIAPDGKHLYTPLTSGSVEQLSIADGFLGYMTPPTVAASGLPRYAAMSPDGRNLYSTDESSPSVAQFDIGSDGKLTPKTTASVPAGTTVTGIAVTPNQAPTAAFSAAPGSPGAPTAFDATSSGDPDGSVARYDWDFGDGTTLADGGATPSHVYQAAGSYSVSLFLTDNVGCAETIYTGKTAVCNASSNAVKKNVVVSTPPPGQNTAPAILSARIAPRVFAVNRRGPAEAPAAARAKRGAAFRYTLSEAARVAIAIHRALPGRRAGRRCVKQTRKNRRKRRCTRYVRFGAFGVDSLAGANDHAFSGKIGRRSLRPGHYRATLVATDGGGLSSKPKALKFVVVRR